MELALASLVVLALGPLLVRAAQRMGPLLAGLDGFILVAIGGLVLLEVWPHSMETAGWWVVPVAAIGFFVPGMVEKSLGRIARQAHLVTLVLAFVGVALHALLDGVALSPEVSEEGRHSLPLAVVLHRLPVGMTIWWLLRPSYGRGLAIGTLGVVGLATVAGYLMAGTLVDAMQGTGLALFQALVGGSLLHVVLHVPHPMVARGDTQRSVSTMVSAIGAVAAVGMLWLMGGHAHPTEAGHLAHEEPSAVVHAGEVFLELAAASAPALLLGYLIAGLLHGVLSTASVEWMRRGGSLGQAARGVAFGLPLPICSCGVVPIYRSLVLRGVPATAAMAFLVATPELGLDAVLLSIPLLGGTFTLMRIVAAFIIALIVGWLVGRAVATRESTGSGAVTEGPRGSVGARMVAGLREGFTEMVDRTGPWILLGLTAGAMAAPVLDADWIRALPRALEVPIFALLGMPTYVCATGATPLVAILVSKGVSPGAALAFLLTGPATNLTTFGLLSKLHDRRTALYFAVGIAGLAVALGWFVDFAFPNLETAAHIGEHEHGIDAWRWAALIALALLYFGSLTRLGVRGFLGQIFSAQDDHADHDDHDDHDHCSHDPAPAEPSCCH